MSWRWLGPLLRIPIAVLADSLLLARLVGPRLRWRGAPIGELRTVPLARQPDEVRRESWQAVAGLMLSVSPGSFVIDSSNQPPGLLVHAVREQPSAMQRSVHR